MAGRTSIHQCPSSHGVVAPARRPLCIGSAASRSPFVVGALAALLALAMVLVPVTSALAAASPCDGDPERPTARPAAPATLSSGLGEPFAYAPGAVDQSAVLADVV